MIFVSIKTKMNSKFIKASSNMIRSLPKILPLKTLLVFFSVGAAFASSANSNVFANEYKKTLDPNISEKLGGQVIFKRDNTGLDYLKGLKIKILVITESSPFGSIDFENLVTYPISQNGEIDGAVSRRIIGSPYEIQITNPITFFNDLQKEELGHIFDGELSWGKTPQRKGSIMSYVTWNYFYTQNGNVNDRPHIVLFTLTNGMPSSSQSFYMNICKEKNIPFSISMNRDVNIDLLNDKIKESIELNYFDERLTSEFKKGRKIGYDEGYQFGKTIQSISSVTDTQEAYRKGYEEGKNSIPSSFKSSGENSQRNAAISFEKGKKEGQKIQTSTINTMNQSYEQDLKEQYRLGYKKGYDDGMEQQKLLDKLSKQ